VRLNSTRKFGSPQTDHMATNSTPNPVQKREPCRSRSSLVHGLSVHLKAISPYFGDGPIQPSRPPAALKCAMWNELEEKDELDNNSSVQLIYCQPAPEFPSTEYDSSRIEQLNLRLPRAEPPRRGRFAELRSSFSL